MSRVVFELPETVAVRTTFCAADTGLALTVKLALDEPAETTTTGGIVRLV